MSATTSITAMVMRPSGGLCAHREWGRPTGFKVNARSPSFLGDHGFQDMIVLPGSFYIDMALRRDREASRQAVSLVRNAVFHNPIILSPQDTVVNIESVERADGRVEYAFYEACGDDGGAACSDRRPAARLEIDRSPIPRDREREAGRGPGAFSIEAFQARARGVTHAEEFYGTLRDHGNQYGPGFQIVSAIWRANGQSLGKLSVPERYRQSGLHCPHPVLLDAATQLLASFVLEERKLFVLRAIERIEITEASVPATLWGHAVLSGQDGHHGNELLGDVRVFDDSGRTYLALSGVALTLVDPSDAADEQPATGLVIAANFTAEPLEDPMLFWSGHCGLPVRIQWTPYNQVFQQLLDPGSAFRKNRDGINIILLGLEEWTGTGPSTGAVLDKDKADECFGNRARYVLPNGMEIVHLNRYETDYVYQEVFEDRCYLRHGIQLRDGGTVVDIGANIGLFSLFVLGLCKEPKIYAFEPAPVVYDLLRANCRAHGPRVRAINAGVSDKARTATFMFYEKSSVFSSFHADEAEDRAALQTVVRNMLHGEAPPGESVNDYVSELTADRLRGKACECQVTSVSDIIREHRIEAIDLLKIDAEKSEWDILCGIADEDWPRISQIVMEIHDRTGEAAKRIQHLLGGKGFRCAVDHETLLDRSGLFNLYATREKRNRSSLAGSNDSQAGGRAVDETAGLQPAGLKRTAQDFCRALRSFMEQTSTPMILCLCPRSPAAEAEPGLRAALSDAERTLAAEAGTISGVHTISPAMMMRRYPVKDYFDPHGHDLGRIPYTPECYASIGTALFRVIFNLKRKPFKVIALDCDNTLWKGVCGEDGPAGIEVSAPFRALQEFMIEQVKAGMLLCLCSKNSPGDVLDVFEQRTDMPLKREHLVSWRINWNSKSENLKALSRELDLGLDSFIFVDDNPVECAEVRMNCPDVLTLQLPQDAESIPTFLNHIWAFDRLGATEEDLKRTRMYQEGVKRRQFRERSLSLKDYIRGLRLRVDISRATEDQFARLSQLTFRTNQFNFTATRRSENEIRDYANRDDATCLAIRVVDRFGDYGLAGVLMYETCSDSFKVDALLLSCRVLGRGVEHAVVSDLGQRAVRAGKHDVEFTCQPAKQNQPALEFLTSIGEQYRSPGGTSWRIPAKHLARLEYDPDKPAPSAQEERANAKPEAISPDRAWGFDMAGLSERLQRIGEELCDTNRLGKAIEEYRFKKDAGHASIAPALSPSNGRAESGLQSALLNIWRTVLGRPRIGVNDNFFEVGGTSLRAVQVIARIKKDLQRTLSVVSLFECPTVALLAARMAAAAGEAPGGAAPTSAAVRGRQRRCNTIRRSSA